MDSYDVAIIGAGPIGIELAVALKKRGISYVQYEAGQIGSTLEWWAPETRFFSSSERIAICDVPLVTVAEEKATREEYLAYLRQVVQLFELEIQTHRFVEGIAGKAGSFLIKHRTSRVGRGNPEWESVSTAGALSECRTKNIVLAVGNMHGPRKLGVPGEELSHVSHYLAEPHKYFNKRVLIVGGKNSAIEAAVRLIRVGADVTLSYRGTELDKERIKFWLYPEIKSLMRRKKVRFLPNTELVQIEPEDALLRDDAEKEHRVACDEVLLLTGYVQDQTLFQQLGVAFEGPDCLPTYNSETMESNVSGVYVAGTAAGGTPRSGALEYIETSHIHVERIVRALSGEAPPQEEERDQSEVEQ